MKYKVEITEVLQRVIEIEADGWKDAERKAKRLYDIDAVELDANDIKSIGFITTGWNGNEY